MAAALAATPSKAHYTSLRKWHKVLGLLRSITLAVAGLRGMFTRVQHALNPATARVVLRSSPSTLRHLCSEVECAFLVVSASAAANFYCRLGRRRSRWAIVLMSHPRTLFRVDQAPYSCPSLFWDMGSLRLVSDSSLGRKTRSIWWKR